jgi:hypothetical protein
MLRGFCAREDNVKQTMLLPRLFKRPVDPTWRRRLWDDRHCRVLAGASVIAMIVLLAGTAPAMAQSAGPLIQITTHDTFASCTADKVAQQQKELGSTLYPNTAIEPWVAIDPTDPQRLLVGHQQDRWSDGGSRGLVGNVSNDGGSTWAETIPSGVSDCSGGSFGRASDPWVTFAPDGTAYFFSLVIDPAPTPTFGASSGAMLVSRSTDHAKTWGPPITLIRDGANALNDKNSITADPGNSLFVYAVWDRLVLGAGAAPQLGFDGVAIAQNRALHGGGIPTRGPTVLARTTDGGASWETPRVIFDPGVNSQTINNQVVVLPNGDVLVFFTELLSNGAINIAFLRSTDKGATFDAKPTVASDIQVVGVVTPDALAAVRDAAILFSVAVDSTSGALYLAWQDCGVSAKNCSSNTPIDSVAFSQSVDGGATWSKPVRINQTPQNLSNPLRQQAFVPAIVAAGDGTLTVTYYDFRNDLSTAGSELTDFFAAFCKPVTAATCTDTANWGNELRLSTTSLNMLDAPVARGHFLGDYMGLVASGQDVWPVFGMTTGQNLTADFTRKITLPAAAVATK